MLLLFTAVTAILRGLREELLQDLISGTILHLNHHLGSMHSRERLADDFRALGVAPGDTIMLHASVRAVGRVPAGRTRSTLP